LYICVVIIGSHLGLRQAKYYRTYLLTNLLTNSLSANIVFIQHNLSLHALYVPLLNINVYFQPLFLEP